MPYNTPEKRKAYYERHGKFYNQQFKVVHSAEWNKYQAEYKVRKRRESGLKAAELVKELNICQPNDPTFKAAVILVLCLMNNLTKKSAVEKRTGYARNEIDFIYNNWQANGLLKNGIFYLDDWSNDLEFIITITLTACAGSGELRTQNYKII